MNQYMKNSPKKQLHAPPESLEVDDVVECTMLLDVTKYGHPDDGVYECDERQQSTDVE